MMNMNDLTSLIANLTHWKPHVRWEAAEAKRPRLPAAMEALTEAVDDRDPFTRPVVVEALGHNQDSHAVEAVLSRLRDNDPSVRALAARALGQIGNDRAVEPLIVASTDEQTDVRWEATVALGRLGQAHAVEALIARLRDQKVTVRKAAATALAEVGDSRAAEPLIRALRNGDLAAIAAAALGRVGDARAVSPLIDALLDRRPCAPWLAAAESLGLIALREPTPELREVLPHLRMMAQTANWDNDRTIYGTALHRIEASTAALKDLPLPATAFSPSPEALPLPAGPPSHADGQSISADTAEEQPRGEPITNDPKPMANGWFQRLRTSCRRR